MTLFCLLFIKFGLDRLKFLFFLLETEGWKKLEGWKFKLIANSPFSVEIVA